VWGREKEKSPEQNSEGQRTLHGRLGEDREITGEPKEELSWKPMQ
jgi:hypothetical protein